MTTAITFTGKTPDLDIVKSVISGYLTRNGETNGNVLVYKANESTAREIYATASSLIKQLGLDVSLKFPCSEKIKSKISSTVSSIKQPLQYYLQRE